MARSGQILNDNEEEDKRIWRERHFKRFGAYPEDDPTMLTYEEIQQLRKNVKESYEQVDKSFRDHPERYEHLRIKK